VTLLVSKKGVHMTGINKQDKQATIPKDKQVLYDTCFVQANGWLKFNQVLHKHWLSQQPKEKENSNG